MIAVISPAKSLDMESKSPISTHTDAQLLSRSEELIEICRGLSKADIEGLMKISPKLAELNFERFQEWTPDMASGVVKQAVFSFTGDVYQGLDAGSLPEIALDYLQEHLFILSGLYGLLKPLDLIKAYRLEMGTKLENSNGKNLYAFWGVEITNILNAALAAEGSGILVNLASNEYFKAVKVKELNAEIVTPQFKDYKDGKLKMISFYAKKARGLMLRYIVENKIETVEELKHFDVDGYGYSASLSTEKELVFTR